MAIFAEFHNRCPLEKSLDATFVSLVPKKTLASPISLVGGMYKIISKVLTNKFKSVLGKIISNTQNMFYWWSTNLGFRAYC
jgi:hypothetical protein